MIYEDEEISNPFVSQESEDDDIDIDTGDEVEDDKETVE